MLIYDVTTSMQKRKCNKIYKINIVQSICSKESHMCTPTHPHTHTQWNRSITVPAAASFACSILQPLYTLSSLFIHSSHNSFSLSHPLVQALIREMLQWQSIILSFHSIKAGSEQQYVQKWQNRHKKKEKVAQKHDILNYADGKVGIGQKWMEWSW